MFVMFVTLDMIRSPPFSKRHALVDNNLVMVSNIAITHEFESSL